MNYEQLYKAFDRVDHSLAKRTEISDLIMERPKNIGTLMQIAFQIDDPISPKAGWVLEYIAKDHINLLLPYMDKFTKHAGTVHRDSAIRPMAKICEYLMKSYFGSEDVVTRNTLTTEHLLKITTLCFDWLIGEHKVAAKAYSMTSLLLLGRKFDWIWPELRMILEQNYQNGSAAYRARARMTLAKIK